MSAPDTIRAADAIARRLYDAGCRHAFGMPGGEVLTIVDALEAAGITFVFANMRMLRASWPRPHGTKQGRRVLWLPPSDPGF